MSLLDRIKDGLTKVIPAKSPSNNVSTSMSGGIGGGGHGMFPGWYTYMPASWDSFSTYYISYVLCMASDAGQLVLILIVPLLWILWIWMIVSKPTIVFHLSQVFFNFLAMACFASVASFQARFKVGPSGLSGFAIFISILGIFLPLFMLLIPVIYEKYDKFNRLARTLKEVRVAFILTGAGSVASLLIAFTVTISAWTEPGCKDASKDPNADKGDDFKNGLPGWCNTKKAGGIFFWLAFIFWGASLGLLIMDWRSGKMHSPLDPPFTHPPTEQGDTEAYDEGDDEESSYHQPIRHADNSNSAASPFSDLNRYSAPPASFVSTPAAAPRPSVDAYGAFSDPAPSGFGQPQSGNAPPVLPEPDLGPRVSRTMQYADPYAAVRASIGGSNAAPPSYESPQGYR